MTSYKGDPYWAALKYDHTCCKCKKEIKRGKQAFIYPKTRAVFCEGCGEPEYQSFLSADHDEDCYNGCGSPYAS